MEPFLVGRVEPGHPAAEVAVVQVDVVAVPEPPTALRRVKEKDESNFSEPRERRMSPTGAK